MGLIERLFFVGYENFKISIFRLVWSLFVFIF